MRTSGKELGRGCVGATLVVGALSVALTACAANPRPKALDTAEAAVSNARTDTEVQRFARDELEAAEQALTRAERSWRNDAPDEEIEHLSYLTRQRVAVAKVASEEEQVERRIEELIEEREQVRLDARQREAELAERRAETAEAELERLREEVQAERTERGLVLTIGDILFDVDRAELNPGGRQQLSRVAEFLRENPNRKLLVEGHTDSTGSDEYNFNLSERRASTVMDYLITQGIDANRMVARGYGEQLPVATNETTAGRQQNRRIEIVMLDQGEPLPPRRD